jgi:hypothetical protein
MGPLADVLEAVAGSREGLARSLSPAKSGREVGGETDTYDRLEKLRLTITPERGVGPWGEPGFPPRRWRGVGPG